MDPVDDMEKEYPLAECAPVDECPPLGGADPGVDASSSSSKAVTILTSSIDGSKLEIDEASAQLLALESEFLLDIVSGFGNYVEEDLVIPAGVRAISMALDYCKKHAEAKSEYLTCQDIARFWVLSEEDKEKLSDRDKERMASIRDEPYDLVGIMAWDKDYLNNAKLVRGTLLELAIVSRCLIIEGLRSLICGDLLDMVAGKTLEEVREIFRIDFCFPQEVLEQAEEENISMILDKNYYDNCSTEKAFRSARIKLDYMQRRFFALASLSCWMRRTAGYRCLERGRYLEQSLMEDRGQTLEKLLKSIAKSRCHLDAEKCKFARFVHEHRSCVFSNVEQSELNSISSNEIDRIEIYLRRNELDAVALANEEKEKAKRYIEEEQNTWDGQNPHFKEKAFPYWLHLKEECYSEIVGVLLDFRAFRVQTIHRLREEEKKLSGEVRSSELGSPEDSDVDPSNKDSPLEHEEYSDDTLSLLRQLPELEELLDEEIVQACIYTRRLEYYTRLFLHHGLALKNYEVLTSIADAKVILHGSRDSFRKKLEEKVDSYVSILEEHLRKKDFKAFKQAKENYINERLEFTTEEKEQADNIIDDMLSPYKKTTRTPGHKEAVWYLMYTKKEQRPMIDEIVRQVELRLDIIEVCYTDDIQRMRHQDDNVMGIEYEAESSNAKRDAKRRKILRGLELSTSVQW